MTTTTATPNQLFDCISFSSFNMEQPFTVSLASNALMIMVSTCIVLTQVNYFTLILVRNVPYMHAVLPYTHAELPA
jgi:hypothetical protein